MVSLGIDVIFHSRTLFASPHLKLMSHEILWKYTIFQCENVLCMDWQPNEGHTALHNCAKIMIHNHPRKIRRRNQCDKMSELLWMGAKIQCSLLLHNTHDIRHIDIHQVNKYPNLNWCKVWTDHERKKVKQCCYRFCRCQQLEENDTNHETLYIKMMSNE